MPHSYTHHGNESAVIDRILHAAIGRLTGGTSPIGLSLAYLDWATHLAAESDITFVLTKGGHNAGIVSAPGQSERHYRIGIQSKNASYSDPETWFDTHQPIEGSWWPAWFSWLDSLAPEQGAPPPLDNAALGYPALEVAPGTYVHG